MTLKNILTNDLLEFINEFHDIRSFLFRIKDTQENNDSIRKLRKKLKDLDELVEEIKKDILYLPKIEPIEIKFI